MIFRKRISNIFFTFFVSNQIPRVYNDDVNPLSDSLYLFITVISDIPDWSGLSESMTSALNSLEQPSKPSNLGSQWNAATTKCTADNVCKSKYPLYITFAYQISCIIYHCLPKIKHIRICSSLTIKL